MQVIIGIITLLIVVASGLIITRIATVAFVFTGLSKDLARFQARSAFTGCGFTTSESERVLEHPVRRRIVMILMLLGNGVVVMAISSLIPVFITLFRSTSEEDFSGTVLGMRILLLVAGLLLIWALSISKWLDERTSRIIGWALQRFTRLDVRDYHALLHLSEGYSVTEVHVSAGDWVAGKNLLELRLADEGMQVLGIHRMDGEYIGSPTGGTYIRNGDTLLAYGQSDKLVELERRRAGVSGDEAHVKSVEEQRETLSHQERQDRRDARADEQPADSTQSDGATEDR